MSVTPSPVFRTPHNHSMWRQFLEFFTGPRRIAHGLMHMATADITLHDAHRFLAPYSMSGKSSPDTFLGTLSFMAFLVRTVFVFVTAVQLGP